MFYTAIQHPEAEQRAQQILDHIVTTLRKALPPRQRQQILLVGSYGRGEGGVWHKQDEAHLHNNLDIVVLCADQKAHAVASPQLHAIAQQLTQHTQVGIDLSVAYPQQVKRNQQQIFWHDTLYHHTLLDGAPNWLQTHYKHNRQPTLGQGLILTVNRATLLLINTMIQLHHQSRQTPLPESQIRLLKKHQVKATIGLCDAFLMHARCYTPSYKERVRILTQAPSVVPLDALRERTLAAIQFRFQPDYSSIDAHTCFEENEALRQICQDTLAHYESHRRQHTFSKALPQLGYRSVLPPYERVLSIAKQALKGASWKSRNDRIVQAFLQVIFQPQDCVFEIEHYLTLWGGAEDQNFALFLERYGISMSDSAPTPAV